MPRISKRAFTLVELLVVIGIIALLVAILLPTLSKARMAAVRSQCMSNQRQMLIGLEMYKAMSDGKLPNYIPGGNMAGSLILRHEEGDWKSWQAGDPVKDLFPKGRLNATERGWCHFGMVYLRGFIKDPRVFYCPTSTYYNYQDAFTQNGLKDPGWSRLYGGYLYRIGGIGSISAMSAYPEDQKDEVKFVDRAIGGRFRGVKSITSDFFGYNPYVPANWPHQRPFGMVVGWSDGHVTFQNMNQKDWYIIAGYKTLNDPDKHMIMLFRWAFDQDDLQKVRTALNITGG